MWFEPWKEVMQMNEPKLRFKADDGSDFPEWEEKKLGDITSQYKVRNKKRLPLEIYSVNNIVGFIPQSEQFDDAGYLKDTDTSIYMIVPPKHFAYNPARLDIGSIGYQYLDHDVQVSSLYEVFETSDLVNDNFLWSWFHTHYFNNVVKRLQEGGVRLYFYYDKMQEVKIELPSLPEQQKIADFLSTIDTVIEKQKETVSAWEERKKGVMQKLFNQEVRFKADDGSEFPEWEEKSYLSICNVFADGDWIESKDQSDSGIRLIQTGNIGNGVFIDKDDKKKYISKETFDRLKCNEVFEGDILISRLPSPAGRACIVPKLNERMITAVDCTIVRTDKSIILHDYCVQFMQSSKHFYYVASMMAGGTRQRISRKNLEDELISVPCLEEQQKIADCLVSLDEVIEKQKATLAAWEELKKGLLQQMFV